MSLPVEEQLQAEKARELIDAVNGFENAAAITGYGTTQLWRFCSPKEPDSIPAKAIERLEAVSHGKPNHPAMTRHLARRQGYVLIPLPEAIPGEGEWNRHIANLSTEAGTLISGLALDLADDQDVSPDEAKARLHQADRLVEVTAHIRAALFARSGGG